MMLENQELDTTDPLNEAFIQEEEAPPPSPAPSAFSMGLEEVLLDC
jgi:hypothetical protein